MEPIRCRISSFDGPFQMDKAIYAAKLLRVLTERDDKGKTAVIVGGLGLSVLGCLKTVSRRQQKQDCTN